MLPFNRLRFMRRAPHFVLSGWVAALALSAAGAPQGPGILSLDAIEPGMTGEWQTVVDGAQPKAFELEVVGVMRHFIGPKRPIILCKATGERQILSGPVAGMSGSPVYIDGKLIGAYAYGFPWPKKQTLIGVTPIEQMLDVLEHPPSDGPRAPAGDRVPAAGPPAPRAHSGGGFAQAGDASASRGDHAALRPLPTPLMAGGFSEATLSRYRDELNAMGLSVVAAPMGRAAPGHASGAFRLKPGSAVAGVLVSGDFNIAATGTVTWRQDERILAMGHPFLGQGPVAIPMASAEIVTVARSLRRSFKLANVGPVVGALYQDRVAAVAGEVGREAPTTRLDVRVRGRNDGAAEPYHGEIFRHRELTPLLAAMALEEALRSSMKTGRRQTLRLDATLEIEGFEPVRLKRVWGGPDGAMRAASDLLGLIRPVFDNRFAFPEVTRMRIDVGIEPATRKSRLRAVQLLSGPAAPGEAIRVAIAWSRYQRPPSRRVVEIPIPESVSPEAELAVFVGDASAAEALDDVPARQFDSLRDVVEDLRRTPSNRAIHVKLLRRARGVAVNGEALPALPPSMRAMFASPKNRRARSDIDATTLWQTRVNLEGPFEGRTEAVVDLR